MDNIGKAAVAAGKLRELEKDPQFKAILMSKDEAKSVQDVVARRIPTAYGWVDRTSSANRRRRTHRNAALSVCKCVPAFSKGRQYGPLVPALRTGRAMQPTAVRRLAIDALVALPRLAVRHSLGHDQVRQRARGASGR